jgi:hypothetical protein
MENDIDVLRRARKLFEPIPEEQWITGQFTNCSDSCCAVGHWVRLNSPNPNLYDYNNCHDYIEFGGNRRLLREVSRHVAIEMRVAGDIAGINNDQIWGYQQPTPKQRVMAFLDDAIKFLESREVA